MLSKKIRPYRGDEPYIFISYAHKDNQIVLAIIERMVQDGYRIWYDEGISPGTEWDDEIASHIEQCDSFIAFISNNYLNSENCKDELNFARELEKERLLLYIEAVKLPSGMAMRFNRLQHINKFDYDDVERFFEKLYLAEMLKKSRQLKTIPRASIHEPLFAIPSISPTQKIFLDTIPPDYITDPRYTLIEKVGFGGMGDVYKAFDKHTGQTVAIKFFSKYKTSICPFFTDKTLHNTIVTLTHPNLCKIVDENEIAVPYLVTGYIDGITIDSYLKIGRFELSFKELLTVSHQILEALFLLHTNYIFYGDLSPNNIMLTESRQAYLIDYTECNYIGSRPPNETLVSGMFMSPEKENHLPIDHRSDIYEFGGLFEKMLQTYVNYSRVYYSENVIDVYNTPVFDIVRKAMKRNPNERYQSASEMLEALDDVMANYT